MDEETQKQNISEKVLSTGYKVEGFDFKIKGIFSMIAGIIIVLGGIVMSITTGLSEYLFFSGIGVFVFLGGWLYWKRSKSLSQGRFY
jgi:hypothetical protein